MNFSHTFATSLQIENSPSIPESIEFFVTGDVIFSEVATETKKGELTGLRKSVAIGETLIDASTRFRHSHSPYLTSVFTASDCGEPSLVLNISEPRSVSSISSLESDGGQKNSVPMAAWIWAIIAVFAFLIVAGIAVAIVLIRRRQEVSSPKEDDTIDGTAMFLHQDSRESQAEFEHDFTNPLDDEFGATAEVEVSDIDAFVESEGSPVGD